MAKKITQKEMKEIIKAFSGADIELVKKHIGNGLDPNEILTIKWGNVYGENNPYTLYDIALRTQIWYLTFISETKKTKEQKANLEIVKYITPLITSAYPIKNDNASYSWRAFPFSITSTQDTKIGMFDELMLAMIESGYKIKDDKRVFETIGIFGIDAAKEIVNNTGFDDGDSVYSAAHDKNIDVLKFLLDNKVSVNKPFIYSTGNTNTALHEIITLGDLSLAERLLMAGADINLKNMYGMNCLEWAKHNENKDMVDLLDKYKK